MTPAEHAAARVERVVSPTEDRNPRTLDLDTLDTLGVLRRINAEDQSVALAVERILPDLATAVDAAAERWRAGARLHYFGAGSSGRI
nr:N-acetylmuramic acid 6-phosphate etherase [Euzebyales bacterium]